MKTQGKIEDLKNEVFSKMGHSWACDEDTCVCNGGTYWENIEPIIQDFILKEQNDLIKRVLEGFDIELEAWMEVHYKQNRSFSIKSLVKHMKVFLEKLL